MHVKRAQADIASSSSRPPNDFLLTYFSALRQSLMWKNAAAVATESKILPLSQKTSNISLDV